jgi:hypothetical protein
MQDQGIPTHVFFWPVVAIGFAYNWYAAKAFSELERSRGVQPKKLGGIFGKSPSISSMVFSSAFPSDSDSPQFTRYLLVARVLAALFAVSLPAMLVLIGIFGESPP